MSTNIWSTVLEIIKMDTSLSSVQYDTFIATMEQVSYDERGILILACRDDFSLRIVKTNPAITKTINDAVNTYTRKQVTINYIIKGDKSAELSSTIAASKVIDNSTTTTTDTLSSEYTFSNFIVGDSNRYAYSTAVAVAENPGLPQRNPLFLWSNPGLGKTHLLKAIGYKIKSSDPSKKVLYITCEDFTNDFVAITKNNADPEAFRKKYRTVDVLLIDDIQFLIDKIGTQTEFFNTFEALTNAGRQVIITCDKAPNNLTELNARLTSRFQNGITMDIQPPDFETRKAIFLSKLEQDNIDITDDIVNYICNSFTKNIRELNGAYNRISSYYALSNGDLTYDAAVNALASLISPGANKSITSEMIINAVCQYYGLSDTTIKSSARQANIKNARGVAMYLMNDILTMTLTAIGKEFDNRSHSAVWNAIYKAVIPSPELMHDAEEIKKRLTSD